MSKGLFVSGVGTDVGKTFVSALIVKKLRESNRRVAYFKAAMSGNERDENGRLIPGDAAFVKKFSGISQPLETTCPYLFERAVSPHLAAREVGTSIDLDVVKHCYQIVCDNADFVVVEGSGGILCPLRLDDDREIWLEDVVRELRLPSTIVSDSELGSINRVVLTAEYMRQKNLPVKGIVFNRFVPNDSMREDNVETSRRRTGLPVLGKIENDASNFNIDADFLASLFE